MNEGNTENETLIDDLAEGAEVEQEDEDGTEQENEPVSDEVIIEALKAPSDAVKAALQQIVNEAVKRALARNKPKRSTVKADPITKKQFEGMSYAERENLFNTNRPLYDKLKNF